MTPKKCQHRDLFTVFLSVKRFQLAEREGFETSMFSISCKGIVSRSCLSATSKLRQRANPTASAYVISRRDNWALPKSANVLLRNAQHATLWQ